MDAVVVGRYRVIEELGRGGMGVVYRGEDPVLERPVAIKVLMSKRLNQKMVERFLREAKTAARLDSPYIVKIHDIGQSDDVYFIVMELVDGHSVSDMIEEDVLPTAQQLRERLAIFRQVLEAVRYAHDCQVIHRDLKPDNIMVTKNGQVKVMDFGLAFFQGHHSLTEVGQVMGTAAYVSPEQAQGKVTDQRTDIYSLGVILFELITSSWPLMASNPLEMFRKVAEVPPPSPRSINGMISPALEQIVLRMLAKKPEERFFSIAEILAIYDDACSQNNYAQQLPVGTSEPSMVAGSVSGSASYSAGGGDFDAQALLDSIVSTSDISSEWLGNINLEKELGINPNLGASPFVKVPTASPQVPAVNAVSEQQSAATPLKFATPKPPAPGPALRQAIEQTSISSTPGQAPAVFAMSASVSLDDTSKAATEGDSTEGDVASVISGLSSLAGEVLGDTSAESSVSVSGGTVASTGSGAVSAQKVGAEVVPAQYSAPKSSHGKSFKGTANNGAVASTAWMDTVNENNNGNVENLLEKLQHQESLASALCQQIDEQERSVFCPKCGTENSASDKVCGKCGGTLSITQYVTQREAANFLEEGKALYNKSNYREAVVELLQAVAKDSNSSEAYLYLGRSYLELAEYGQAHSAIERAINLSTNAAPYVALADFYLATEQQDLVISALHYALDREPYEVSIRCRLAFAYGELGRWEAAVEQYQLVLENDPQNLEAVRQVGFILAENGHEQEAIPYLEQLCYLDPRCSQAYSLLSRLHIKFGHIESANQVLRQAIAYDEANPALHSELADLYIAQDQSQLAVQELTASLELEPGNSEASQRLAALLYRHGQVGEAVQQLEESLKYHPHSPNLHRQLGEIYIQVGHLDQALDHFEALVALDPQSADLYNRLGRIYQKKNYAAESLTNYQKAVEMHPVNSAFREDLAMAYYSSGQLPQAAQEFAKAARLDYTNPEYPKALGMVMVDMGQYEEAVRQLKHSLDLNGNDPQTHGMLARAFVGQGLNNLAISEFQKALDMVPQWYFLNLPLARAYAQQGKYDPAIQCFKSFMQQAGHREDEGLVGQAYVEMGFSYLGAQDYQRAIQVFKAALQRNRNNAEAWRGMALVSLHKKKYDQAQQCLNQGLQIEPRNLDLQIVAADIQGARNAWSNAISIMQTAREQHPDVPEAYEHLGRALRKGGRLQDAVNVFNEAIDNFPEMAGNFLWLRGRVEFRQGQYDAALWSYRQALEEVCDDWRIYVDLGKACLSLRQMADAREAFNNALRCAPEAEKISLKKMLERLDL